MCFVAWQRCKGNQGGHKIPRWHLIVRVTHIQGAPSHPTTPLGPSRVPKAHQKHALGPKSLSLFCLVVSRPAFHHLQVAFAYRDRTATNPILGVAIVSWWCRVATNLISPVSRWCRVVTNTPNCACHVLNTCPLRIFSSILAIGCKIKGQDDSIG